MGIYYFANIGKRDVIHSEIKEIVPRLSGREWLEDYNNKKTYLDFPILRPGLEYVLKRPNINSIHRLCLFYTDQPKNIHEKHRQSDTLYFAELIKIMVLERFENRVKQVELIPITGAPNDYDEMFQFYSQILEKLCKKNQIKLTFLVPAGGTPACNMNLVLHGSRIFGPRSQTLFINEAPGAEPKTLNISAEIIRSHNRNAIRKMAEGYNYHGIASLLRFSSEPRDRSLMRLAQYAAARLGLDFDGALGHLAAINDPALMEKPLLQKLQQTAKLFLKPAPPLHSGAGRQNKRAYLLLQKRQICEICLGAIVKYKTGQFTDCMGRIFRINEGLARWFFEYYTGYSSNTGNKFKYREDFTQFTRTEVGREFHAYLQRKKNKKYRFEPNRTILIKFWDWVAKYNPLGFQQLYPELLIFAKRMDQLGNLRNESSIAHGFAEVTEAVIAAKYRGNLLEDLNALPGRFHFRWNLRVCDEISAVISAYY